MVWLLSVLPAAAKRAYHPRSVICGAAADGDVKKVEAYLKANPTAVHERDHEYTPLHWAALHNRLEVVNLLLANGADVNASPDTGHTPLHAGYSNARIVRALLANQANPNAKTKEGKTPLLFACSYNHDPEVVRALLLSIA